MDKGLRKRLKIGIRGIYFLYQAFVFVFIVFFCH